MCVFDILSLLHKNDYWTWDAEMAQKFKDMCICPEK